MEQDLLTLPEHPSSSPVILVGLCYSIFSFMCMFCRLLFILLHFPFGHCVVCSSSIYGLWLPLWYLQTLLCSYLNSNTNQSIITANSDGNYSINRRLTETKYLELDNLGNISKTFSWPWLSRLCHWWCR